MIDWADEVKQYKGQERNGFTQEVSEWVESLVPIYYSDIFKEYYRVCSMNEEITSNHVGLNLWQLMTHCIFEEYLGAFYTELNSYDEEE